MSHDLLMWVPLAFAIAGYSLFTALLRSFHPFSFLDGLFTWLVFVFFSFIGEYVAHEMNPEAFKKMGDSPLQVAGAGIAIFASFVICPIVWALLRKKNSKK